jgi:broad specificity phosphatase PhoE
MFPLVYFVRHGLTDWNAEGRLQGQAETELNEVGLMQADRNGKLLSDLIPHPERFDFVASPMRRTRQTMERIRAAMGLQPEDYRTDPRLMELHFGDWQGFTLAELEARVPGSTEPRSRDKWGFLPPGAEAESYEKLANRFAPWLQTLERPTVCVTHGGIVRCVFHLVEGMRGEVAAGMLVPQDQVLELREGKLSWR